MRTRGPVPRRHKRSTEEMGQTLDAPDRLFSLSPSVVNPLHVVFRDLVVLKIIPYQCDDERYSFGSREFDPGDPSSSRSQARAILVIVLILTVFQSILCRSY